MAKNFRAGDASNVINLANALNSTKGESSQSNKESFVQFSCAAHILNLIIKKVCDLTKTKSYDTEFYYDEPGSNSDTETDQIILTESEKNIIKIYQEVIHKCRRIAAAFISPTSWQIN
jgi:hypothetical protein